MTQNLGFETGRITGIQKETNCTLQKDAHGTVGCSRLPDSMSLLPCLLKLVLVKYKKKIQDVGHLTCLITPDFILASIFDAQINLPLLCVHEKKN